MRTVIRNGSVIQKNAILRSGSVLIENGKILIAGKTSQYPGADIIDAMGCFVSPGFIDTHIHGDPAKVFQNEIRYGTTAIVTAISCAPAAKITSSINAAKSYLDSGEPGGSLVGVRLEGPYISKIRAGAQNKRYIAPPSANGLKKIIENFGGMLKIMTIAPELKGAAELIKILRSSGVIASIGHTDAGGRELVGAVSAGARHVTHLFNGMRKPADADDEAVRMCFGDTRVNVEIIFDMIHVKPELVALALSVKDKRNIILITDSVRAEIGSAKTEGGVYRLKDGTIAGSCLTMIGGVKNAVRRCGVSLIDAVRFASANPARVLGISRRKGAIAVGQDADIVIFDKDFDVKMTIARGNIMYRKRGF